MQGSYHFKFSFWFDKQNIFVKIINLELKYKFINKRKSAKLKTKIKIEKNHIEIQFRVQF